MKERPILFSGPMVRAILDGRKTQTRRVVKNKVVLDCMNEIGSWDGPMDEDEFIKLSCPYGSPADRLWVRETWADLRGKGFDHRVAYGADTRPDTEGDEIRKHYGIKWKPSIHMPRWASRITLEITGVRVERLQEISLDDLKAEAPPERGTPSIRGDFWRLWDDLNADRGFGWSTNPWVWVIEFKRIEQ